ncbi:MAG: hypothetical protein WCJ72_02540 [Chryseobacterium sp.]
MEKLYRLKYGNEVHEFTAKDFQESLIKLSSELKIDIKENQVTISSVLEIK